MWIAKVREPSGQLAPTLSLLTVRKARNSALRSCGGHGGQSSDTSHEHLRPSGQQLLRTPIHEELRNRHLLVSHLTRVDTVPGSSSLALSKQPNVRSGLARGKTQDKDLRSHLRFRWEIFKACCSKPLHLGTICDITKGSQRYLYLFCLEA